MNQTRTASQITRLPIMSLNIAFNSTSNRQAFPHLLQSKTYIQIERDIHLRHALTRHHAQSQTKPDHNFESPKCRDLYICIFTIVSACLLPYLRPQRRKYFSFALTRLTYVKDVGPSPLHITRRNDKDISTSICSTRCSCSTRCLYAVRRSNSRWTD